MVKSLINRSDEQMYKKMLVIALTGAFTLLAAPQALQVQAEKQEQPWRKYPDNTDKQFEDATTFYRSLDKKQYNEYPNAKLNIRKLVKFRDVNAVLAKATHSKVGGTGIHPNRQVYVYASVSSQDTTKTKDAVFDAETGRKLLGGESN